jgi:multidrug efflux system membrane fusion protein
LIVSAFAEGADVPQYLDEIGSCAAREKVAIKAQVAGRIVAIHFEDGADLHVGDRLFSIESATYAASLARAKATFAQNSAKLDQARNDFARVKDLLATHAISRQDFDDRKNAVDVATALLEWSQADVQSAEVDLEHCEIRSPIEGRAGRRLIDIGNVVRANDDASLLVVQRLDPIYVDFTVPEGELALVQKSRSQGALRVEVRAPGDDDARVGELTFVDNAVQEGSGTLLLRATLANTDRKFWPGQFVRVRLVLSTLKGAVLAPARAVQISATGPYVYVVKADSTAELRPVVQGQRQGDRIVITSGLNAGERIVIDGHVLVAPGAPVMEKPASRKP